MSPDERKQVEQSLRESQQLLQAVADNSTAIIWVKDLEGRYLLINGSYEKLFDLRRDDILGKTDYDLFPKEQAEAFRAVDQEALAAGTAVQAEEVALHGNKPIIYSSVKCPLWDERGEPYALCGISTDITERKRLEARFHATVESAPTAMAMIDATGLIVLVNAETEKLFGYPRQALLGQGVEVLVPQRFRAQHTQLRSRFLAAPEARRMGAGRDLFILDGPTFTPP